MTLTLMQLKTDTSGSVIYKPFSESDDFTDGWWDDAIYGFEPSQHFYSFFVGQHEVARAEIEVQDVLNPEYEQPAHLGPYAVIHFFEVSEDHRRKGYGTDAVQLLADRHAGTPLVATPRTPTTSGDPSDGPGTSTPRSLIRFGQCTWETPVPSLPAPASVLDDRTRAAVVLKMTAAGLAASAAIFLLMVATAATSALRHLPEVYWPDASTRHNLYGVLLIIGLVGSVLTIPCALVSYGLYRAARRRAGTPPRAAAVLGAAAGAAVAFGVAAAILFTP